MDVWVFLNQYIVDTLAYGEGGLGAWIPQTWLWIKIFFSKKCIFYNGCPWGGGRGYRLMPP